MPLIKKSLWTSRITPGMDQCRSSQLTQVGLRFFVLGPTFSGQSVCLDLTWKTFEQPVFMSTSFHMNKCKAKALGARCLDRARNIAKERMKSSGRGPWGTQRWKRGTDQWSTQFWFLSWLIYERSKLGWNYSSWLKIGVVERCLTHPVFVDVWDVWKKERQFVRW